MQFTPLSTHFTFIKNHGLSSMPDPHYHNHYEIYYLLSGEIEYFISDTFYTVKKNSLVLIRPMELHKTSYKQACKRLIINFNDTFLRKYLTPAAKEVLLSFFDKRILSPSIENSKIILQTFENIERETQENQSDKVFLLLNKLFIIFNDLETTPIETPQKHINPTLNYAIKYIDNNYGIITDLKEVADNLHVSKYYICKLFKKHLNTTFGAHLLKTRLQNAEKLLFSTKKNISQIATECGFSSSNYFCKIFKEHHGLSPKKYRESQIEKKLN